MKKMQNLMQRLLQSVAAASVCLVMFTGPARAENDVIAQWTFETSIPTTAGPHAAEVGTGAALGFHSNGAAAYSNPVGNGSGESFSSNNWLTGDYYQFQASTLGLSDIGVTFDQTRSSTGPNSFQFQYSTNGTTFTDFGDPYNFTGTSWSSTATALDTSYSFDLRSVAALNNQANVTFRLLNLADASAPTGTNRVDNFSIFSDFLPADPPPPDADPRLPVAGDVVFGQNSGNAANTLRLVSGNAVVNGGVGGPGPWSTTPFIQSVAFDNSGGVLHNAKGNLLGVNFNNGGTGQIYSFATKGSISAPAGELIGNTSPTDPVGQAGTLTQTALAGISVSPNNSKVAVVGTTVGSVIVYDYTPGDTFGAGAALANGRQTSDGLLPASTQGTAWLNDSTVLTFSVFGELYEISDNGTTLTPDLKTQVATPVIGGDLTSIAYNPDVSSLVYAMYSGFASGTSAAVLYIFDPANSYNLVNQVDLSNSIGSATAREIALDAAGNLFIGGFGGVINVVPDAVANAAALTDDSSVLWYTSPNFSNFSGLDVGFAPNLPGDFNGDGLVDAGDYTVWRDNLGSSSAALNGNGTGAATVVQADFALWKSSFGNVAPGSGGGSLASSAAVPEPASLVMLMFGLVGLAACRRR